MSTVRVSIHHHYELELKLVHQLDAPSNKRTFDAWLYFPSSLGVDEPTFQKDAYYDQLTGYIRFRTPRMSVEQLFADGVRSSPFSWLADHEERLTSGSANAVDTTAAIRELRLGAAMFRAAVRDHVRFVGEELGPTCPPAVVERHVELSRRFLADSRDALDRFRVLRLHCMTPRTPALLRAGLDTIDDFMSVQAMEGWFGLREVFFVRAPAIVAALDAAIAAETGYRASAGLLASPSDDALANERFVARVNQLKKWVLAVLHLQVRNSRRTGRIQDMLFGVAAAVAMTFAVVLQLVAVWTVGTPTSPQAGGTTLFAFVGLAVGGYILKDRLKDWLKAWFAAGMPNWLYDRRQELKVEASGAPVGFVEETVRMMRPSELSPLLGLLRERDEDPLFAEQRATEDVLHYRRTLNVDGKRVRVTASEMTAIDEILRLNVGRWLRRMDDPERALLRVNEGAVESVRAAKTYRVLLVVSTEAGQYARYSIVLRRDGIARIEPLSGL